tara:strand:- start:1951 stop:2421 length:471 start_codon:yes stop_codon:yes gene_type:complete
MKNLCNQVVRKSIRKKINISLVESCTGGLLSSSITSVSGSSKIFNLGLVTYSNESKIKILKVSKKIIKKYGTVSKECCFAMVKKLNKMTKTNISVSITGIAGPKGGTKLKPVGLVFIGIQKGKKIKIYENYFKNKGRLYIQRETVKKSLKLIQKFI